MQYEKECLEDDSSQCTDLAEAAAEAIVYDEVCKPDFFEMGVADESRFKPDYKRTCMRVAENNCPSEIENVIARWCPKELKILKRTSRRERLESMCGREVRNLVGDQLKTPGDEGWVVKLLALQFVCT